MSQLDKAGNNIWRLQILFHFVYNSVFSILVYTYVQTNRCKYSRSTDMYCYIGSVTNCHFVIFFFFFLFSSLKMDCEKLVQEKTEMQRHYVMVMFFFFCFFSALSSFLFDATRRGGCSGWKLRFPLANYSLVILFSFFFCHCSITKCPMDSTWKCTNR